jgi:hypothetical protein
MPLYRFSQDITPPDDDFAVEFADDAAAIRDAMQAAADLARNGGQVRTVRIWDAAGRQLLN